jgi:hypothetical protein
MGLIDKFKTYMRQFEVVSRNDGFVIGEEDLIYDIYYSILSSVGCSSKHMIDDECDMLIYVMDYMRNQKMISILEAISPYYFIRKRELDELIGDIKLD